MDRIWIDDNGADKYKNIWAVGAENSIGNIERDVCSLITYKQAIDYIKDKITSNVYTEKLVVHSPVINVNIAARRKFMDHETGTVYHRIGKYEHYNRLGKLKPFRGIKRFNELLDNIKHYPIPAEYNRVLQFIDSSTKTANEKMSRLLIVDRSNVAGFWSRPILEYSHDGLIEAYSTWSPARDSKVSIDLPVPSLRCLSKPSWVGNERMNVIESIITWDYLGDLLDADVELVLKPHAVSRCCVVTFGKLDKTSFWGKTTAKIYKKFPIVVDGIDWLNEKIK